MNILAIFFHFPPISGGGVIVAVDIVNSLAKSGHEITVLTPNLEWSGPKYEPEINSKVDVMRVNVPSKNNTPDIQSSFHITLPFWVITPK